MSYELPLYRWSTGWYLMGFSFTTGVHAGVLLNCRLPLERKIVSSDILVYYWSAVWCPARL